MLTGKHGKLKAMEPKGAHMNLENEVRTVLGQTPDALTVDQATQAVAERIKGEIRSILNAMAKNGELKTVRGARDYRTTYQAIPIKRRA
jgi:predicted oxidoreductase